MRLSIEVTKEQHQQVVDLASEHGMTVDEYVLDNVLPVDERKEIRKLGDLLMRRLEAAKRGAVSTQTPKEIYAEVLQERREDQ